MQPEPAVNGLCLPATKTLSKLSSHNKSILILSLSFGVGFRSRGFPLEHMLALDSDGSPTFA